MRFTTAVRHRAVRTRLGAAACALLAVVVYGTPLAAQKDGLAQARTLYNERLFEEAIAAADQARLAPDCADAADLIAARAFLERYRESGAAADLSAARERLRRLNPHPFGFREQLEYIVGLGQALFFEGLPGAAADVFASALEGPYAIHAEQRERILDWWASAMDGDARPRADIERQPIYQEISTRMRAELSANPASAVAAYWTAAAARGRGDLQSAWDAAQAGWVRAPLAADYGVALRGDLDRLVQRAIIPERARVLSQPPERLLAEWEQFKERWNR